MLWSDRTVAAHSHTHKHTHRTCKLYAGLVQSTGVIDLKIYGRQKREAQEIEQGKKNQISAGRFWEEIVLLALTSALGALSSLRQWSELLESRCTIFF